MENITQITVKDLDSLRTIVDIATQRGAFRAAELSQIGAVYDKLTIFLDAVLAQAAAASGEDTASAESTVPTQGD
jgi:hypothetical protein